MTAGGIGEASGELRVDDQIISVNGIPVQSDIAAIDIVRSSQKEVMLHLLRATSASSLITSYTGVDSLAHAPLTALATTAATSAASSDAAALKSSPSTLFEREVLDAAPKVLDFYKYLQGYWKRNLQWREFGGGFRHLQSSNTLVCIEADGVGDNSTLSLRSLRWKFGNVSKRRFISTHLPLPQSLMLPQLLVTATVTIVSPTPSTELPSVLSPPPTCLQ